MQRRRRWPILLAGLLPAAGALPGLYLGVRQVIGAWRHPPPGGLVGLGMVLGFWLLLGSLFVLCAAVLLTGIALDLRELRNRAAAPRD